MKSVWLITLFLLASVQAAFSQGITCYFDYALTSSNTGIGTVIKPALGGTATVCSAFAVGVPCAPKATLFNKSGGIINNPVSADIFGNFSFCTTPGRYQIQVSGAGSGVVIQDNVTLPNDPNSPVFTTVNATTFNGSLIGNVTGNVTGNLTGNVTGTSLILGGGTPLTTTNQTGTGILVLQTSPSLITPSLGVASATSVSTSTLSTSGAGAIVTSVPAFIDMSGGAFAGSGGFVQSTNDASTTTGYGAWLTNNAYWNGTNWIQPRGTGIASTGFTANFHKGFSFNRAAAVGTNNTAITWTEVANISSTGLLTLAGVVNGPTGTVSNPTYSFSAEPSSGWFRQQAGIFGFTIGGTYITQYSAARIGNTPLLSIGWASAAPNGASDDINISRVSAGVLGVGTGTQGSTAGTLQVANIQLARVRPRAVAVADGTSITPNSDASDIVTQTNTQVAGTLTIAAPTGTPTDGQKLVIRIKTTNAQTYSFNATYHFSSSIIAPSTIAAGKTDYIGCMWNATNTAWDVVAVDQGH